MKKRKGLLLKLGFLGIGLVSSSAMVIGSFANLNADDVHVTQADTGDFYQVTYAGGELTILLSANPASYKHINGAALTNLKNSVINAVTTAISEDLDWISATTDGAVSELEALTWIPRYYAYVPTSGLDADLLAKMVAAAMSTNGVADIDKVDAFNNDPTGAYSTTVSFYADRYADAHPELDRDAVYADIAGVVADKAQEMTDAAYTAAGYDSADIPSAAANITQGLTDTKDTGVTVELPDITQVMSVVQTAMAEDSTISVASFISEVGTAAVSQEIKDVLADANADDIQEFLTNVQADVIADTITVVDLDKAGMEDILDTIGIAKLLTIAEQINVESIKTILQAVPGYTAADLQEFLENNFSHLSVADIITALVGVRVDGLSIYENGQFKKEGLKAFVTGLPKPGEIANFTDDEMRLSWNVEILTTLGAANIDLTLGFYGNCDYIRLAADFISKAVDFSYQNGELKLDIKSGEYVAKFLRTLMNSTYVPDTFKQAIFKFFTNDVQGMYETLHNTLLSDIIADLQGIDYESALATLYSADFLNSAFNTNKFTEENLDKLVDMFMRVFNRASSLSSTFTFEDFKNIIENFASLTASQEDTLESFYNKFMNLLDKIGGLNISSEMIRKLIDPTDTSVTNDTIYDRLSALSNYSAYYDRAQNLLTKIYNKLPESLKTKKFMSTYKGNGLFAFSGDYTFDLEDIFTSFSAQYGQKAYDLLESFFGTMPTHLKVDFSFEAKDVYSVTYDFGNGETLVGALPSGVDVPLFAGQTTVGTYDIQKWVDVNGDEVTLMPAQDIVVYAVIDFDITPSSDVSKVYDGADETISVSVYPAGSYTYQWQKDGVDVAGATSESLDLVNVEDSGSYTCVVTRNDGMVKTSDPIVVTITPIQIDVTGVAWENTSGITFDGSEKTVAIDPATLPAGVSVSYTGTQSATAAGTYTVVATLTADDPNTVLVGSTTLTLDWTIYAADIDVSDVAWDYTAPFTYDGETHTVQIDPATLPDGVGVFYTYTNEATDAGLYHARATLYCVDSSFCLAGETVLDLDWAINAIEIDISTIEFSYTDPFTYDGNEHGVEVDVTTIPEHVVLVSVEDNAFVNAGNYLAVFTFETDSVNYSIVGNPVVEIDWVINKVQVNVAAVTWTGEEFTYDGSYKEVAVNNFEGSEYVEISYTGTTKAVNADQYVATVTFTLLDADNYELVGSATQTIDWVINQATLTVSGATWNYTAPYEYNGQVQIVTINASSVDAAVVITYTGTRTARDAGTYSVTATFAAPNANYKVVGSTSTSLTWKINPKQINVSSVSWNYSSAFVYNGQVRTVAIDGTTLPDHVVATYGGTYQAANAGSYTATVTLTAENANYTLVGTTTLSLNWKIDKAEITIAGILTDYNGPITFDGNVHKVAIDEDTVNVEVEWASFGTSSALNAGNYSVTFVFISANNNYVLVGATSITVDWKIVAATIDVSNVSWANNSFTYTGSEVTVALQNVPNNVDVVYGGTYKATNAGNYSATATLATVSNNYVLVGNTNLSLNWEIKKAVITLLDVEWATENEFKYDEQDHTVSVKASSIPNGVEVTYSGTQTASAVGNYQCIATFSLKAEFANNYELQGNLTSVFDWAIVNGPVNNNFGSVEETDGVKNGYVKAQIGLNGKLHIELKDADALKDLNWTKVLNGNGLVHAYYDVYFVDNNGNRIDVGSANSFEVSLLLPQEAAQKQANYKIVLINEDGTMSGVNANKEGNYMVFNTNLLGNFAIVEVGTNAIPWWVLTLLIVAGAVIAVETYVIIVKSKKK